MRRTPTALLTIGGVLLTSVCATLVSAQEPDKSPKPAARAYGPIGEPSGSQSQEVAPAVLADTRPLTGAQVPTLGSPELPHSYWVPGIQYGNFVQSSSTLDRTVSNWNSTSYIAANVSLVEFWRHAQLNVNYSGGSHFSTDNAVGNGQYQQLGLMQQSDWRKWQLSFLDQFSYLPQTQFGFGAGTNLSLPGIGGPLGVQPPGLQASYVPSQSIYSALGPRYSNAFVSQIGYRLSPRGDLTVTGSYGILHFTEAGNIDTFDTILNAGYSYQVSRSDTLGVGYRFTSYHYADQPQAIGSQTAQVFYGRKLTGRLALLLSGGPEIAHFRVPIGATTQHVSGAGTAHLTFAATERTTLSAGYTHAVSGGSGVFTGSLSDQVDASIEHEFTKAWRGGLNFGYAHNSSIESNSVSNLPTFDNWYAGVNIERSLGRDAHLSVAYTAQLENSSGPVSSPGTPATSFTLHQITVEFGWHTRPFVLR